MRSRKVAVISVVNGATGTAAGVVERSAVTGDALEDLVRASEQAARDAGPAEDAAPLVEPTETADRWDAGAGGDVHRRLRPGRARAGRGVRPGGRRAAAAVRLRRARAGDALRRLVDRRPPPPRAADRAGRRQRQVPGLQPVGVGRPVDPRLRGRRRGRARRRAGQAARLGPAVGRAAPGAVRDGAAADRGRGPDVLPLHLGRGAGRRRRPDGLLQGGRRHPDRRAARLDPGDTAQRPGGAGAGVRAVRDGDRLVRRPGVGVRQRLPRSGRRSGSGPASWPS